MKEDEARKAEREGAKESEKERVGALRYFLASVYV